MKCGMLLEDVRATIAASARSRILGERCRASEAG